MGERGRRDPGMSKANEEARQLARGKRVVPQTPQTLIKHNGPTHNKLSQLRVFKINTQIISKD
ncbi:hypothetical protein GCM10011389_10170 [Pontibacillus salipaludis]|uniref:Uncharacterized protein n=1 Tax=Pontibacillus salipaludis TaxID=1697394 RepID=A0ABQ1PVB6_9BACI|nr:hypothetical protein GCM10011389_10170 [Pontibacillus salipaludis]